MVAYAPADDPKYVVAANVDGGDWGSTTAILMERIMAEDLPLSTDEATILGLGIGPAVALHEGSTLLVVFNALRLLAWRGPRGVE